MSTLQNTALITILSLLILTGCSTKQNIVETHSSTTKDKIFLGKFSASVIVPDVHIYSPGGLITSREEIITENIHASNLFENEIRNTIGRDINIKNKINDKCIYFAKNTAETCHYPLIKELRESLKNIATNSNSSLNIKSPLPSNTDLTIYTFSVSSKKSIDYAIAAIFATIVSGNFTYIEGSDGAREYTRDAKKYYSLRKQDITGLLIIDNKTKMIVWYSIFAGYAHDITNPNNVKKIFTNYLTNFNK